MFLWVTLVFKLLWPSVTFMCFMIFKRTLIGLLKFVATGSVPIFVFFIISKVDIVYIMPRISMC